MAAGGAACLLTRDIIGSNSVSDHLPKRQGRTDSRTEWGHDCLAVVMTTRLPATSGIH